MTMLDKIEYRTVDKSDWPDGPWNDEPDKMQWKDEATGMPCLIVRGPAGALCGYAGVSEGHPLFEKHYSNYRNEGDPDPESILKVHGGITYAEHCQDECDPEHAICHIAAPGEPDHVWWFGFDCAHAFDYMPAYGDKLLTPGGIDSYRDLDYVIREVTSLANQLVEYARDNVESIAVEVKEIES
jgi:hypothetical protein